VTIDKATGKNRGEISDQVVACLGLSSGEFSAVKSFLKEKYHLSSVLQNLQKLLELELHESMMLCQPGPFPVFLFWAENFN
jgi:hypothetical protein